MIERIEQLRAEGERSIADASTAAALEELRRKNRRVTVVVVTPCTKK